MREIRAEARATESIPDLLRALADEAATLVHQEIALAKAELSDKARGIGASAGAFAAAAVFGLGAFGALTATLIALIALALPVWAAALIVAALYAIVAVVSALGGRERLARVGTLVPEHTAHTVKEDIEWLKTRAQSKRR